MKRLLSILFLLFCLSPLQLSLAASDPADAQGGEDPALFSRMPGFHIYNFKNLDYNRFDFPLKGNRTQAVEGRHAYIDYYANEGIRNPSGLQIVRNYRNAAAAIGGKVLHEYEDGGIYCATIRVSKNGAEAWAFIEAGSNGMYKVNIIEKQLMNQEVVADAKSLAGSINETGKAAVYGIYFDTAKSSLKSESGAAIAEIVKLLKGNARLKLYVVGHTDNVGKFESNIRLSQARAAAVVNELVRNNGISAARLTPFGAGPAAPVASNREEDGRAKNRRVELVAQ